MSGLLNEFSYSIASDDDDNYYIGGYYSSDTLYIDINDTEFQTVIENNGVEDIFIAKYTSDGNLEWVKTVGGKGSDKVYDLEFFDDKIFLSGYFTDTINWGGIQLASQGVNDKDMLTAAVDKQGNFREANQFKGRNNSLEEARGLFKNGNDLYTILRSNSDQIVLGDSIYTSDGIVYSMYIGIIGCLPISVDNTQYDSIRTCYGDSNGYIEINATGGFGAPWVYSIDNNQTSSASNYFPNLPAGDYQVVVIDKEGCTKIGPLITLTQPDTLAVTYTKTDILVDTLYDDICTVQITQGSISAAVTGGSGQGLEYILYPGGILKTTGTFFIDPGDSGRYVIRIDDSENCGPVEADSIEVLQFGSGGDCIPLGFEDGLPGEVKVYPNPTTGLFTLEMPFGEAECPMEVYNMNGQVVLQQQLYPNSGKIVETIDLSKVPKGLYLLRINGRALQSAIVVK